MILFFLKSPTRTEDDSFIWISRNSLRDIPPPEEKTVKIIVTVFLATVAVISISMGVKLHTEADKEEETENIWGTGRTRTGV